MLCSKCNTELEVRYYRDKKYFYCPVCIRGYGEDILNVENRS